MFTLLFCSLQPTSSQLQTRNQPSGHLEVNRFKLTLMRKKHRLKINTIYWDFEKYFGIVWVLFDLFRNLLSVYWQDVQSFPGFRSVLRGFVPTIYSKFLDRQNAGKKNRIRNWDWNILRILSGRRFVDSIMKIKKKTLATSAANACAC